MRFFAALILVTSFLTTSAFAAPAYPVAVSSEVSEGDIEGLSLNEQEVQMRAEAILSARGWRLINVRDHDDYQCPQVSFQFPRGWLGTRSDRRRTSGNTSFFDGIFGGGLERERHQTVGMLVAQGRLIQPDGSVIIESATVNVAAGYTVETDHGWQVSIPITVDGERTSINLETDGDSQFDSWAMQELLEAQLLDQAMNAVAAKLDARVGQGSAYSDPVPLPSQWNHPPAPRDDYSTPVPWPQRQTSVGVGGGGGLRPMAPQGPLMLGGGRPRAGDHVISVPSEDQPLLDQALARGQALPVFIRGVHIANVVGRRSDGRYFFRPVGGWDLPIGAEFEPTYGRP